MDIRTENLHKKIQTIGGHIYKKIATIENIRYRQGEIAEAEQPDFDDSGWEAFSVGQFWGGRDVTCWFRMPLVIPAEVGEGNLAAIIQPGRRFVFRGSEGGDLREYELLVYLDGEPLQSVDVRRNEIPLWDRVRPGGKHLLAIEAFSGLEEHRHCFEQADVVLINKEVEEFYFNCKNIFDTILILEEHHPDRIRLFNSLQAALLAVDFLSEGSPEFYRSVHLANERIREIFEKPGKAGAAVVSVGHAHLDIAWMWQTKHSVKKAARTFANALRLMELYPDYHFLQSQAQLYQYVRERYPSLYERMKEKVKHGQWEVTGGMWVEPDANIPSGESLVRQFLYGKRFFQKEFGVDVQVVWLPDGFGFCYSLPQIIKKAGMRYFVTTKLSWNQFTKLPYDSFLWQGLDGTRILTHMITTPDPRGWNDYSVDLNPTNVMNCWKNYRQKNIQQTVLLSFGWGDGGGGPTREMQENTKRLDKMPGLPAHRQGRADEFFAGLEKCKDRLPVWNDELYLQLHRGCYTSQAWIKKSNRDSEILYHNAELFATMAFLRSGWYPQDALDRGWQLILLNQFHDILPGSSIPEVYSDARKEYEEIRRLGTSAMSEAMTRTLSDLTGGGQSLVVFNSLSWPRHGLFFIDWPQDAGDVSIVNEQGQPLPIQVLSAGNRAAIYARDIPPLGYRVFRVRTGASQPAKSDLHVSTRLLENRFFKIVLDEKGLITSIYDKRYDREIIEPGRAGNVLQIFEDRPLRNNAWDIDIFYQDKCFELTAVDEIAVTETGPIRGGVAITRTFKDSTIRQTIYIYEHIPRIDFDTQVEWQQHQTLLKVAFPVQVHANKATYEIPYGNIERPTHWNTDWDWARFEVPAQKWADLSEGDYGVSLLNDCKYGYDIKDNVMRLTLIKSAVAPDPNADIGRHQFLYSLWPHKGDWRTGATVRAAYELNYELIPRLVNGEPGDDSFLYSFLQADRENVIVETVKKEEEGDGIVVRLYEVFNQRGSVELTFHREPAKVFETNLLEQDRKEVAVEGNKLRFYLHPYEIKTFIVKFLF